MTELFITSSILILTLLLLRKILHGRISRRLQYGLWILVALRLLLPFSIPAPTSVMNGLDSQVIPNVLSEQAVWISPKLEQQTPQMEEQVPTEETAALPTGSYRTLLRGIWGAGALAVGGYFLAVNLHFKRELRLKRRRWQVSGYLLPVYCVKELHSPCLFGLLRPAVYVTEPATEDSQMLRHILVHEYCHYRQWDHLWSIVRTVCLAVYWFHPLVWVAAFCSRNDCELSCDELAVRKLGEPEKVAYGRTLLTLVNKRQHISAFACTATTMGLSRNNIEKRIRFIIRSPKTAFPVLVAIVVALLGLISCTFTSTANLTPQQAVEELKQSIVYEEDKILFTLPKRYPDGADWNLLVYGRAAMGENGGMSVHLFETENADGSWQPGKQYEIDLSQTQYLELWMEIRLHSNLEMEEVVNLLDMDDGESAVSTAAYQQVSITFPAYSYGRNEQNEFWYSTSPFDVHLPLPQEWSVQFPEQWSPPATGALLWTPMEIWDEQGNLVGQLGFNRYESEGGEDLPQEELYKLVYTELRLSRKEIWDPYTPVRTDAQGESAIAQITYMDPTYMQEHPQENWASVPTLQTTGILCYNTELMTYVGLRFESDYEVDQETIAAIAQGIELMPSVYGLSGKRYTGSYFDRDYSGIQIQDADGYNLTPILIDLWYCASDAYDLDGITVFQNGEWVQLAPDQTTYIELIDYDEVMPRIFTQNAIAQYESSPVVKIQRTEDGKVYRLAPWKTGYSYAWAMTDMEAVEVTPERVTVEVIYQKNTGDMASEKQTEYGKVPFTIVKQDGVWLVDSYQYPES